jgi:glycosyltransferase involved in cell wall biosynthesis
MKISIITVVWNNVKTIKDTIDSVLSQTYKNIEYIVIDGGSTDGTLSLLESRRDQLSALVSEPDEGIYDAMNKGIKLAKGDVIGFLNSDDFYLNDKVISKVASEFERDIFLDASYANLIYVDQTNTSKIIRYFKTGEFKQGLFLKGWCPAHPTFFVRKSVYERNGNFDLNYHFASDVELMMRFLEIHKIKSLYIPEVMVKMRMGGVSNRNLKNIWLANKEIINSFHKNGLQVNSIIFFIYKIISRLKQYIKK